MKKKSKQSRRQQKKLRTLRLTKQLDQARACYAQKQFDRANALYQQVLQREPENVDALYGLGVIALDVGMHDTAVDLLGIALRIDDTNINVKKKLALAYTRLNRFDRAIDLYPQVLSRDQTDADIHGELARLLLLSGQMDAALEHYRIAFERDPSNPKNLHGLMRLDSQAITPEAMKTIEAQLDNADLPLDRRSSFYFALGWFHDRAGRYDEAFVNYSVANLAKPMRYNHQQFTSFVTDTINTFTPELFNKHEQAGNDSSRPVYIVGMPRSGTTLVEQILASHTAVHAAGETSNIENLAKSLAVHAGHGVSYPQILAQVSAAEIRSMGNVEEALMNAPVLNGVLRVTDKMPVNFLYLGLLALLFPNAHIIHCRRDPLDTCLSCYFQNFSGNHPYASDLHNLGQYYRQYQRLMEHWYKVLPVSVHTVDYETLVAEPEHTIRDMLSYVGLEWQDHCLQFHRTQRTVQTASLVQVRRPLYRTSVARWRHYDEYLQPLKAALGQQGAASTNHPDAQPATQSAIQAEHASVRPSAATHLQ